LEKKKKKKPKNQKKNSLKKNKTKQTPLDIYDDPTDLLDTYWVSRTPHPIKLILPMYIITTTTTTTIITIHLLTST
jgi:hypothetical protein